MIHRGRVPTTTNGQHRKEESSQSLCIIASGIAPSNTNTSKQRNDHNSQRWYRAAKKAKMKLESLSECNTGSDYWCYYAAHGTPTGGCGSTSQFPSSAMSKLSKVPGPWVPWQLSLCALMDRLSPIVPSTSVDWIAEKKVITGSVWTDNASNDLNLLSIMLLLMQMVSNNVCPRV